MTGLIPLGGGITIGAPDDEATTLVPDPRAPIKIAPPPDPSPVLVLPSAGPAGGKGDKGDPGDSGLDDVPDLTLLFENGLI